MRSLPLIISVFVVALLVSGCTEHTNPSTEIVGGDPTGDLIGTVAVISHRGQTLTDSSGVTVRCDGTNFSATSDASGNWVIHNLPTRTYSITFSKPGCYSWTDHSFSYTGGVVSRYRWQLSGSSLVTIGEYPEFTVTIDAIIMPHEEYSDSAKKLVPKAGFLFGHTSNNTPNSTALSTYIVVSSNSALNIEDPTTYDTVVTSVSYQSNVPHDTSINFSKQFTFGTSIFKRYAPGQIVYFRAYPVVGDPAVNTMLSDFDEKTATSRANGYGKTASNILSAEMK